MNFFRQLCFYTLRILPPFFHIAAPGSAFAERHKSKDLEILESAFRGRALTGAEIKVPHGFHGSILERQEENEPTLESSDESPHNDRVQRCKTAGSWKVTGRFDRFLYWNHDLLPNKSDSVHRAMEWPDLAAALHRPIDPDAVHKALQDVSQE